MTDQTELIRRIVAGEVDGFRFLIERYQRPVFRLIRNLIPDPHTCEDLAQDVFMTAFHRLDRFHPSRASFSTWLLTIARNKCLNELKRKTPTPTDKLPEPAWCRTPCEEAAQNELFEQLDRALASLPVEQKTTFVLAELVGLSYEEIAQVEGVRPGTVRSRISRAKERLRSLLGQPAKGDR